MYRSRKDEGSTAQTTQPHSLNPIRQLAYTFDYYCIFKPFKLDLSNTPEYSFILYIWFFGLCLCSCYLPTILQACTLVYSTVLTIVHCDCHELSHLGLVSQQIERAVARTSGSSIIQEIKLKKKESSGAESP